jgi:starch synthase (maltosyl-transferring)
MADSRQSAVDSRQSAVDGQQSSVDGQQSSVDGQQSTLSSRVVIDDVRPVIDGGRFPIKRTPGEIVDVTAVLFADGHDIVVAVLRDRAVVQAFRPAETDAPTAAQADLKVRTPLEGWRETPLTLVNPGTDLWSGRFDVGEIGWHEYSIVAWVDRFATWRRDVRVKYEAGVDVSLELLEGELLIREAAARADQIGTGAADAAWLSARADALGDANPTAARVSLGTAEDVAILMHVYADRSAATESPAYRVWVDRERARTGAWYEMFPRSAGPDPARSATFREAANRLSAIADLGFDVVYLPPIHPIGRTFRKGRNNALYAADDDPGSPWAIGSSEGGHTAVEPGLGTLDDFTAFREKAERLHLEVALDLAWQCSPDHPWVREHPDWFRHRPDGTIKYAENPPKKYQDIYPLDFENDDWPALWQALLDVTLFWVERGVRIFRVDNPHTKTLGFWGWLIGEVQARDPRVIFLSEAFTRPRVMEYLAKAGFTQSYTYFTWRNSRAELTEYFTELARSGAAEYLRPNLFANTPDILHEYLQHGGRPAFRARLLLAATLGANYGIYSGFELCENRAVRPGSEEYADSEKYQFRHWDWDRPGHIKELVARINRIRHRETALQHDRTLRFHETDNPQIIAFSKTAPAGAAEDAGHHPIFVVVSLDPFYMQHGFVRAPFDLPGEYKVRDLLADDTVYTWRGEWNYVRFDPDVRQGHVLKLEIPN